MSHGRPGFYFRVIEEGEVEAGDKMGGGLQGPERMTVAEVNALLYTPGHSRSQLERAVDPALSAGWRGAFQALLNRERSGGAVTGNPGLARRLAHLRPGRGSARCVYRARTVKAPA